VPSPGELRGQAVHHRQAEPRALAQTLGREEGFDRARQGLGIHAVAGVGDAQHGHTVAAPGRDRQDAARRHGVTRVQGEVEQRQLELMRIALRDRSGRLGQRQPDPRAKRALQQPPHPLHQSAQIDGPHLQGLAPRESEQPLHEYPGALGRLQRARDHPLRAGIADSAALKKIETADDRRQQVVEVVRDPAGQLAHALQLLRLSQRVMRLGELGRARGDPLFQGRVQLAQALLGLLLLGDIELQAVPDPAAVRLRSGPRHDARPAQLSVAPAEADLLVEHAVVAHGRRFGRYDLRQELRFELPVGERRVGHQLGRGQTAEILHAFRHVQEAALAVRTRRHLIDRAGREVAGQRAQPAFALRQRRFGALLLDRAGVRGGQLGPQACVLRLERRQPRLQLSVRGPAHPRAGVTGAWRRGKPPSRRPSRPAAPRRAT
jgi:hypothetical protein